MPRKKITPLNEEFDFKLFVTIAKKNALWFGFFLFLSFMFAFLYLRYTAPIYEATTIVKLSDENNAGLVLDQKDNMFLENMNQLAGDIELIRSKIIAKRAISKLQLDVSYFAKGTVLDYELYNASPFEVEVKLKDSTVFNKPFFVEFRDNNTFTLRYTYQGEKIEDVNYKIDQWISFPFADFKVHIRDYENISSQQKEFDQNAYYFMVNNLNNVVTRIVKDLVVTPLNPEAKTVTIKLKEKNSAKASDIVNNIAEEFNSYDVEKSSEAANNILNFIDTTLSQVNINLSESEDRLEAFKRENKLIDPTIFLQDITGKINNLQEKASVIRFQLQLIAKMKGEIKQNNGVNNYLVQMTGINKEGKLSRELDVLSRVVGERDELLIQSTDQTEIYKAYDLKIENQKSLLMNLISNEQGRLEEELKELDKELFINDSKFGELPQKQAEFGRLSRMYGINEKFYSLLLEKKAEFSITRAGFVPKNVILEKANPASAPVSPNRPLIISASLIIGFVISFLLIIVRYLVHDEIGTLEDIEPYTDAALLGIIPKYKREIPISQLLVDKNPKSIIAEAFRSIRTNLQFISNDENAKVIAVTSTISGEGKL
ncbi:MAG: hypothetical protein IPL22_07100 [Bacteroidetes bacterium]|nr:hypothetical protein [Bacteroidota bacterium]